MSSVRDGMSEAAAARLKQFNEEQKDWRGVCRVCHTARVGSLADLRTPCPNCGAEPHGR